MKIEISNQTIFTILDWFKAAKTGNINLSTLDTILNNKDYQTEFNRYNNRVNQTDFRNYLIALANGSTPCLINPDIMNHHPYWVDFINRISWYEGEIIQLLNQFKNINLNNILIKTQHCFPTVIEYETVNIVFTFGIGQSFGFPYQHAIYFDILQAIKDHYFNQIEPILSHEIHHILLNTWLDTNCHITSLEDYFYISFASEGLAIKFTQNAEGILSKPLDKNNKNIGLDSYSLDFLNNDFINTFEHFITTTKKLQLNQLTKIELDKDIHDYWLSLSKNPDCPNVLIELKHSRLYSFGNELWGTIYDAFGLEVLFDTLANPKLCLQRFKKAYKKLNLEKTFLNDYNKLNIYKHNT